MKTVRVVLTHDAETIHPMHRFVAEHDEFDSYRMVHGNFVDARADEDEFAFIFHVVGDADAYKTALEEYSAVRSFELTRSGDRTFSVYVRDVPDDVGDQLLATFSQGSLVPLPPVEYRSDWTVRFSLVGEPPDLRRALEDVPDGIEATVSRVGEYDGNGDAVTADLTARQREALRVARDLGYFEVPRTASVEDVATELGCAPGTATEHLRKAKSRVMNRLQL